MVMSKVTLNVSAPASVQPQNSNADNSFSDVLGGVSTERRQAGLSDSSKRTGGGMEGEFRYTEQRAGSDKTMTDSAPVRKDRGETDETSAAELLMTLLMNISSESEAENEPVMPMPTTDAIAAVSEKSGEAAMLTSGISAEAAEQELPEITDGTDVIEAAEMFTIPVQTETESMTAKLDELLAKAKEELDITKVVVRKASVETEQAVTAETIKPHETAVKVSSDKVDELNSILKGEPKETELTEKTENTVHTETDNAVHMAAELIGRNETVGIRAPEQELPVENAARPPEVQTADEILSRIRDMEGDRTEFTMVLNPESLGRITVKLVMTGEKVALDISAENPETRQLLEARAANLQSTLRNSGVELESYKVVTREEEAQQAMQQDSYDGSSRNPYGRQQQTDNGEDDDDSSFYELLQSI